MRAGGLSRSSLKYIAAAAMLIDHAAAVFLAPGGAVYLVCRMLGRMTAPIMCFFAAEGFYHTSSRKKYLLRMMSFALIAQPAYALLFHGSLLTPSFNMLYTLLVSLAMLWAVETAPLLPLKLLAAVLGILLCYAGDWSIYAPIWILGFYLLRSRGAWRYSVFLASSAYICAAMLVRGGVYMLVMHLGLFAAFCLLCCYNGESGGRSAFSKWFFYLFYPAHLYVIFVIKLLFMGK